MKQGRPVPRPTVAARFRAEIEQAASEGVPLDDMALHLTLGDVGQLKRDRAVPVADISFAGGAMTYLGVNVVEGDVPLSVLRRRDPALTRPAQAGVPQASVPQASAPPEGRR